MRGSRHGHAMLARKYRVVREQAEIGERSAQREPTVAAHLADDDPCSRNGEGDPPPVRSVRIRRQAPRRERDEGRIGGHAPRERDREIDECESPASSARPSRRGRSDSARSRCRTPATTSESASRVARHAEPSAASKAVSTTSSLRRARWSGGNARQAKANSPRISSPPSRLASPPPGPHGASVPLRR